MADIHPDAIQNLIDGNHGSPLDLLGCHQLNKTEVSIRVFNPYAASIDVVKKGGRKKYAMQQLHDAGLFEVTLKGDKEKLSYRLEITPDDGEPYTQHDPYMFPLTFTEYDLHLFNEGKHYEIYNKLGAHAQVVDEVDGVRFAVWAPNAFKVAVIGDFNHWNSRMHPMVRHGESGVWELFVPGLSVGTHYKFEIRSREGGYRTEKSDPYAFWNELRPRTASIVYDNAAYEWQDAEWMEKRTHQDPLTQPMAMYEAHLGSWRRKNGYEWLTYRELADELVSYLKDMNYTHVELMPVAEHPFDGSWGYQVTGYFSPTSRFGNPDDFKYFVDQCHQNGIGVILDWVPAHFPKDGFALSYFDGTHLYEHADPRQGEHPDWGTYIFNYGRNEVRNFLISNVLFWLKEYHIDGVRVDAVSSMLYLDFGRKDGEWIPNQYGGNESIEAIHFLREMNEVVHKEQPGAVTIAEESTSWGMVSRPTYLGGLGFTFKWDMGWMHDTLEYISKDPVYRKFHHHQLTFSMMYAFSENFVLSLSHDEVVHGKGSLINKTAGDEWQKFAGMRLLFGYQYTHTGKKLNFMGQEFGQWAEWSEARSLDWHLLEYPNHKGLQTWMRDLNGFYKNQPALFERDFDEKGFTWIEADDVESSVYSFIRFADDPNDFLVVVCNFTPLPRHDYRVGVHEHGYYTELLNSDAEIYGGGNLGNDGGRHSDEHGAHGRPYSLRLNIPPLAILVFKLKRD